MRREQQLSGKILGEIRLLLMCSGGDYTPGRAMAYTDPIQQPFGHQFGRAKVQTTISFTLEPPSEKAKEHTVSFTTRIDADAARPVLYQAYQEFAQRRGLRMPKSDAELGTIDFRDDATFVLDAKTGFPRSVEHTRVVKIGGATKIEKNRMRLLSVTK